MKGRCAPRFRRCLASREFRCRNTELSPNGANSVNRNPPRQNNLSPSRRLASIANEATANEKIKTTGDTQPLPEGKPTLGERACRIRAFRPRGDVKRRGNSGRTNPRACEAQLVSNTRLGSVSGSIAGRERTQIEARATAGRPREGRSASRREQREAAGAPNTCTPLRGRLVPRADAPDLTIGPPADRLSLPRRKGCCADELRGFSPDRLSLAGLPGRRTLIGSGSRPWFRLD